MKKILLSLVMLLSAMGAMADNWSIDFSVIGANNNLADKAGLSISEEVTKINKVSMGTCTLGEALNTNFVMQTGTSWIYRTGQKALYSSNSGGRSFGIQNCTKGQIITLVISALPAPYNATLKSENGNTRVYTVDADGGVAFNLARYNYIYSISVEDNTAATADYTIKYVDGEGKEIKEDRTATGDVNAAATILDGDKTAIVTEDGTAYLYVADNAAGKTVAEDGSTVITITFRQAANYSYKVVAVENNNVISTIFEGIGYETQNATYYFPYYIFEANVLYATSQSAYGTGSVTLDADNKVVNISYTADEENNAVFYSEAENISTLTPYTDQYTQIRMSNGSTGYAQENGTVITTLPAGKYILVSATRAGTTTFSAGENEIGTLNSTGAVEVLTSPEFTLNETTDITVSAGDSKNYFDYVLIRKTNDVVTGINTVATPSSNANVMYNLAGQRVNEAKGIVIMNGKKIVK